MWNYTTQGLASCRALCEMRANYRAKDLRITSSRALKGGLNALYIWNESSNSNLLSLDLLNSVMPLFVMMGYI